MEVLKDLSCGSKSHRIPGNHIHSPSGFGALAAHPAAPSVPLWQRVLDQEGCTGDVGCQEPLQMGCVLFASPNRVQP